MPTTRQLELFIAVAEAGSMRRAADRLGISQPSVSKQIRALERSVGGELIVRSRGERACLSALGSELLDDARKSVELQRRLVSRDRSTDAARPRIYLRSYLHETIKRRLDQFEAAGLPPDTAWVVSDDPMAEMCAAGAGGNSFAIFGSIRLPARKDFISHMLLEQSCSVYAATDVARALHDGRLRLGDLVGLVPTTNSKLTPWLADLLQDAGVGRARQRAASQFIDPMIDQVSSGEGVAIFMDLHARPHVEAGRLVPIAPCRDPLLLVLLAEPDVDTVVFERVCRALHKLGTTEPAPISL